MRALSFATEGPTKLADNRVFDGHAFALVQQVENFLRANLRVASTLPEGEFRRQDRPSFPWGAVREGGDQRPGPPG
jgi:hypothetical protein